MAFVFKNSLPWRSVTIVSAADGRDWTSGSSSLRRTRFRESRISGRS